MLRKWKMLQIGDRFGQGLACKVVGGWPWHLRRHNQSPTGALVAASRRPAGIPPGPDAAASPLDIPGGWDPRTNQQPTGLLIALPAAVPCCSNPSGSGIKRKLRVSRHEVLLFMDLEGFEPLTSRMRTERSPMRTLKKPPKDETFLLKNGKKHRRNAGFRTSIAFEKKLPFLLQCKKVTLQERCASDVI